MEEAHDGGLEDGLDTYRIGDGDSNQEEADVEEAVRSPYRLVLGWMGLGKVVMVVEPTMKEGWISQKRSRGKGYIASYPIMQRWLLRNRICASWYVPLRRRILPLLLVEVAGHWLLSGQQNFEPLIQRSPTQGYGHFSNWRFLRLQVSDGLIN